MKIVSVHEGVVPISSSIRNAWIDFSSMDCSIVAVVSDVVRDGEPLVGYGFNSNGRYSAGEILRRRVVPRLLDADPDALLAEDGQLDPARAWDVVMTNEKPGGHGERSVAVGVVDMALFDLAAKIAGQPLYRWLSDRYGDGDPDDKVFVYAAGGYYAPGKTSRDLQDEMRGFLDQGYRVVKMKIGGADLAEDLERIEAVLEVLDGDGSRLAVDVNGRFDLATALDYARAIEPYGLFWYEEIGDPLDYRLNAVVSEQYRGPIATGENLFSLQDARNLIRYGGLRPDRDYLQFDPALGYGLTEYLRIQDMLARHGWSSRRCIPHGGHQFSLHIAAALKLGGNESYPGEFQPTGGFADGAVVEDSYVGLTETPGIGFEQKAAFHRVLRALH
ncbi:mandelate racemase/muconate lactonizing enzyme family protein [Amycolatopsis magusensis]|uniref:L-alanine-DL-glutamate epimerase-like enolase superfamily enzyme n=1 Tax=Amycolatopsis magusensis TaxID=882444 RepID=A0ABS4Q145_9PSEU|nr:mandelate racemase/muconate lactonizing enzyme family protein [Amycolatopsis magusensis]MBP2185391.1 L-alanine-DL-glutamate epimerase-like enolase superfamily enzyme [Amycolatopsis magusensis]MDI5977907.1 mandelate racemase/muconate lactonizing enzyme family protein [Amycolatopsis magusensis]